MKKINKRTTGKKIIFVMILLSAISVQADRIELGSTSSDQQKTIYPGESGSFTAEFFNMGENPIYLSTQLEYDREISVEVAPSETVLTNEVTKNDTSQHASWLILNDGRTYVRLYPVKVYVYVPDEVSKNTYKIKLTATARGESGSIEGEYGQKMAQVREYTFTVYTKKTVSSSQANEEDEADVIYDTGPQKTKSDDEVDEGGKESTTSKTKKTGSDDVIYGGGVEDSTHGGSPYSSKTKDNSADSGSLGITQDEQGNTNINLPTGKIVLDKKQTETVMDVGLITLIVSVLSLVVRIIK